MPAHVTGEDEQQHAGDIRRAPSHFAEAFELLFRMAHAPRSQRTHGHHGQCQPKAERGDEREPEGDAFELQADEQHGERGGARHQAAGDAEQDDLRRADGAALEPARDVVGMGAFVRVLKFFLRLPGGGAVVMMVGFAEFHAATVAVIAMAQGGGGIKFVRLGDVAGGFEVIAFGLELKGLFGAIGTDGFNAEITGGGETLTGGGAHLEHGGHAVFEHGQFQLSVAEVEVEMFAVTVVVAMMMVLTGVMDGGAGAEIHPDREHEDGPGGTKLEIGIERFGIPLATVVQGQGREHPDDERVGDGGRKPEQHGLTHSAANGDDESGHERLGMAGFEPVQGPEQNGGGNEKPQVAGTVLQSVHQRIHGGKMTVKTGIVTAKPWLIR